MRGTVLLPPRRSRRSRACETVIHRLAQRSPERYRMRRDASIKEGGHSPPKTPVTRARAERETAWGKPSPTHSSTSPAACFSRPRDWPGFRSEGLESHLPLERRPLTVTFGRSRALSHTVPFATGAEVWEFSGVTDNHESSAGSFWRSRSRFRIIISRVVRVAPREGMFLLCSHTPLLSRNCHLSRLHGHQPDCLLACFVTKAAADICCSASIYPACIRHAPAPGNPMHCSSIYLTFATESDTGQRHIDVTNNT